MLFRHSGTLLLFVFANSLCSESQDFHWSSLLALLVISVFTVAIRKPKLETTNACFYLFSLLSLPIFVFHFEQLAFRHGSIPLLSPPQNSENTVPQWHFIPAVKNFDCLNWHNWILVHK